MIEALANAETLSFYADKDFTGNTVDKILAKSL